MARFIALGKLTREGAMTIKEGGQRFAKAQGYFQPLGVRIVDFYATLGPYDFVAITEGPDDLATVFKSATFVATFGSVEWTTMPAMPYADFTRLVQELPTT
jgi:uncharacterized protein with GYD domain